VENLLDELYRNALERVKEVAAERERLKKVLAPKAE
jgi:hypothetical protein